MKSTLLPWQKDYSRAQNPSHSHWKPGSHYQPKQDSSSSLSQKVLTCYNCGKAGHVRAIFLKQKTVQSSQFAKEKDI